MFGNFITGCLLTIEEYCLKHTHTMPTCSVASVMTLCDLTDCSPPGSSVHGILQVRRLKWVAMPSCRGSSPLRDQTHAFYVSCIAGTFFFFFTAEPPGKCPLQYTHSILQNLYSNNKSRELLKDSRIHAYYCQVKIK